MCSTSVPTLFQYFFYDHIPTFLYIFHEMFFITCIYSLLVFHLFFLFHFAEAAEQSKGKYNSCIYVGCSF